jgi:retron-type reverse transcriptase
LPGNREIPRSPQTEHDWGSGRSQHNALDALYTGMLTKSVNWVLDLDIRSFFDGLSHEWLVKFIEHRIADRGVVGSSKNG